MKSKQEKINIAVEFLVNGCWLGYCDENDESVIADNIKYRLNLSNKDLKIKNNISEIIENLSDSGWLYIEDEEEKNIIIEKMYSIFNEQPLIVEKLPENIIEQLNKALEKACVKATPEYLSNLLSGSRLKKQILEINGVDTAEREIFLSMLGHKLTGLEWPCNADTEEYVAIFSEKIVGAVNSEEGLSFKE